MGTSYTLYIIYDKPTLYHTRSCFPFPNSIYYLQTGSVDPRSRNYTLMNKQTYYFTYLYGYTYIIYKYIRCTGMFNMFIPVYELYRVGEHSGNRFSIGNFQFNSVYCDVREKKCNESENYYNLILKPTLHIMWRFAKN